VAVAEGRKPRTLLVPVPVVDLPLGATEDRVVGALDLERALAQGVVVMGRW
jgi:magnesium chelatase subunit I